MKWFKIKYYNISITRGVREGGDAWINLDNLMSIQEHELPEQVTYNASLYIIGFRYVNFIVNEDTKNKILELIGYEDET